MAFFKIRLAAVEQETLLSGEEYDIERVRQIIDAVTASADFLEEQLLPGSDAHLSDFQTELEGDSDDVD
jgi:hypothetical protein